MKYNWGLLLGAVFALSVHIAANAQQRPENLRPAAEIFKNFSGYVDDDGKCRLEGEGYNIVITSHVRHPNASNFKKVAEAIPGRARVLQDKLNNDPTENYVLDASLSKNKPPIAARVYIIAGKDDNVLDIGIARYNSINPAFVNEIVSSIFYDSIYAPMLVSTNNNVIDFAGRKIKFDGNCFWLKPHVVKCTNTGEVTWRLFNSLAEAEAYRQAELWIARKEFRSKMNDTARVHVIFEGKETIADKYQFESDEYSLGYKDNKLVNAYYIAAEVRGRFVYCRLVFSDIATRKSDPDSGLPLLIAQFIKFK